MQLGDQGEKLPGQLSGGQQQRVAIARAIVIEPPLVLMDEPLSNLDAKLRLEMRAEIRRIHELIGSATIYVTHDQDEALSLADRIVVMQRTARCARSARRKNSMPGPRILMSPSSWAIATRSGFASSAKPANRLDVSIGGVGAGRHAGRGARRRRCGGGDPAGRSEGARRRRADRGDGGIGAIPRPRFYCSGRTADGTELYFRSGDKGAEGRNRAPRRRPEPRAGLFAGGVMSDRAAHAPAERLPLRMRLALYDLDGVTLLVAAGGAVRRRRCSSIRSSMASCCRSSRRSGGWFANYRNSSPIRSSTTRSTRRSGSPFRRR